MENLSNNYEFTIITKTREIILLEDLNSRTGKKYNNNVIGRYGEETVSANGIRFSTDEQLRITEKLYQSLTKPFQMCLIGIPTKIENLTNIDNP